MLTGFKMEVWLSNRRLNLISWDGRRVLVSVYKRWKSILAECVEYNCVELPSNEVLVLCDEGMLCHPVYSDSFSCYFRWDPSVKTHHSHGVLVQLHSESAVNLIVQPTKITLHMEPNALDFD